MLRQLDFSLGNTLEMEILDVNRVQHLAAPGCTIVGA